MDMDIPALATAVVATIAPFTPYLLEASKAGGIELAETIAKKGGQAAWDKAQQLWKRLNPFAEEDPLVKSALTMLADKPANENRQEMLIEVLATALEKSPQMAKELLTLIGGEEALMQVIVDNESIVRRVRQSIKGKGSQTIKVTNKSKAEDISQNIIE
jgi:hypothetical protein